jgi:hypothetical protein
MITKRYGLVLAGLLIMALVAPVAAGTNIWSTTGLLRHRGQGHLHPCGEPRRQCCVLRGGGRVYSYTFVNAPAVSFTSNRQTGTPPLDVTFTDTSTQSPGTAYQFISMDGSGVYRSTDSGSGWTHLSLPGGANLQIRALAPYRATGSTVTTVYAGSYGGGVYKSTDSGTTWSACSAQPANLNVLSLVTNSTGALYAGTEAGVFVSTNDCTSWVEMNTGLPP